ncbi:MULTISPECIES: vWA domain-containing protein [Anaerostipes]|uniref:vWA domain-containing protein n=1 Tax=Anaerostipes TaxID=207244 RepID=UPI00258F6719|nr:VWA-like domain-containing protein [Anaerostipes sp.]MCI5622320.1 VWA-like domain-containing protein [Anaerostipes sp.]MDY2725536.1 VWA-like domain-containing protein [Anaerostipes faecalis]
MEENLNERLDQIGKQILRVTRNELYIHMRFLDVALSSFFYVMDPSVTTFATDGNNMFFHPAAIGGMFRQSRISMNRSYLHMVLHCLLHHVTRRRKRDIQMWNLACDIAVESIMDHWYLKCIHKPQTWLRKDTYRKLEKSMKVMTAEGIYRQLMVWNQQGNDLEAIGREFYCDDHRYWPDDPQKKMNQEIENKWKNISEKTETDMETFSSEESQESGNLMEQVQVENRERYDYREFLRKFATLREEVTIDPDTFDYTFYTYGLSMYGNMPLIEPQEWKEVKKVQEFAIVIDTSMSCSGDLVKKFLEETYGVLSQQQSFFHKVNIHIIQCDEEVQNDRKITDERELKEYMENLELVGEGGTDFRPAFEYVDSLIEKGEFHQLKGLIYFTDGKGTYPKKMPSYETAFIFMQEEYEDTQVPPWAIKLVIDAQDLEEGEENEH